MSQRIVEAEAALMTAVGVIRNVMEEVVGSAAPQTVTEAEAEHLDTAAQALEAEMQQERQRIAPLAAAVGGAFHRLREYVARLGDGNGHGDVSVTELDRHIAALNEENVRLGEEMVRLYDEAAAMASAIEAEIIRAPVVDL